MQPTDASVDDFIAKQSARRQGEARTLIDVMRRITGEEPVLWGPSIIGFGSMHYRYESGREGDMPKLAFSPRKAKLTLYFDGFDQYADHLSRLGKHTSSVSCLYANSLADLDLDVLTEMLEICYRNTSNSSH